MIATRGIHRLQLRRLLQCTSAASLCDFQMSRYSFTGSNQLRNVSKQLWPMGISSQMDATTKKSDAITSHGFAGRRFYAKATVAAAATKLRIFISSPGMIGEPYKKPPPPLPFVERWFSLKGWRIHKKNLYSMFKTAYSLAQLRKKDKSFKHAKFYDTASDMYKQINKAFAEDDRSTLRKLVTEDHFSKMKHQLRLRQEKWDRVHWELVGPLKRLKTLQARLIGIDPKNTENSFAQITVEVQSYQIFAAFNKQGKQVAGDLNKKLLVEDIWVFEKHLVREGSAWRLCAQL